jgi:hypothetical protein
MAALLTSSILTLLSGCSPVTVDDPVASLTRPDQSPRVHAAAIDALSARPMSDDEVTLLRGIIHRPGYVVDVREAALGALAVDHQPELFATIELHLPRIGAEPMGALLWRTRLCEIIAERGWADLTPTLIRAWAVPMQGWIRDDFERPEYLALARLHGRDQVMDEVFDVLVTERSPAQQGLRASCWTLLARLGERARLAALLDGASIEPDDGMLLDLQAGSRELGIVPVNREEILWVRKLREESRRAFWAQATGAVARLPAERRAELHLRDLSILVAASTHDPDLFNASKADLYAEVESHLRTTKRHAGEGGRGRSRSGGGGAYDGYIGTNNQSLRQHADALTWGDLAAMVIVLRAMAVPEVRRHLFEYADADLADESTEYGGVIALDGRDRFVVREFPPRVRFGDTRFEASQEMFDAGYDSVFHFHFHAQSHDNADFAGPGMGDLAYADATRANCLVFTFVNRSTLNVDFYRHDRVVVDLGEIMRPADS